MGEYYPQNYTEKVKLGGIEIPCQCWVEVSEGGKIIVNHNGIKEQTGWKDKKVTIRGRLEGKDEDELNAQIRAITELGKRQEALSIVSKETDTYGIQKIVIENNPQLTLILGFDLSRNLVIEGMEDREAELHFDLSQKKREEIKRITDPKKEEKKKIYTVKKGDTLSSIATREYGNFRLWRRIYAENKETIGPDPNKIKPGQELII